MAAVGDARIASNGCKMAKRVKRRDTGFRVPSSNIAAIDFGTTNCSLAYLTVGEEGPKRLPLNVTYYRVPTAILFTPDGSIDSFGYDARAQYLNLDDEERLNYAYFEQIKMDLQHDETVSREMKIRASNDKEYYLVDVIAQILKYLKNELIENHLKRGGFPIETTEFDWVITVPAIWRARGKQMMREAGYKAGLCSEETCGNLLQASWASQEQPCESSPDKLSLALESESASLYCQNMTQQHAAVYCKAAHPYRASSFLVVDIGGGTVDISAHCGSSGHIEAVHPPTGNDCGGSRVNLEFRKFLENLVNDPGFSRYLSTADLQVNAKNIADLNCLINDIFERQKQILGRQDSKAQGKLGVRLPFSFMVTYANEIQRGIQQYSRSEVQLSGQHLRMSYSQMQKFFEPIVDGILGCIAKTIREVEAKLEVLYLVGGFGGCQYIYTAIHEHFGDRYRCIVPAEPDFAIVRGAVLYRRNPELIRARRVDATYGVKTNIAFDPSIHDDGYKWKDDDNEYHCKNIFMTIVERGEAVTSDVIFTANLTPVSHNQKGMFLSIYSSPEKDVWYTTGKRGKGSQFKQPAYVHRIGEFELEMPILSGDKSRTVDITFDFSHTEIQVKGYDRTSGSEVKVVLDFLSQSH